MLQLWEVYPWRKSWKWNSNTSCIQVDKVAAVGTPSLHVHIPVPSSLLQILPTCYLFLCLFLFPIFLTYKGFPISSDLKSVLISAAPQSYCVSLLSFAASVSMRLSAFTFCSWSEYFLLSLDSAKGLICISQYSCQSNSSKARHIPAWNTFLFLSLKPKEHGSPFKVLISETLKSSINARKRKGQ